MISVIIPFKDAAPWLRRCLNSLLIQSGDFEFIFVNDHSEDDGGRMIHNYKIIDERIRLVDNHNEPGVSGARNTGIDLAKGEYITFLDADDELRPDAYKIFTSIIKNDANIFQFNHLRHYARIDKTVLKYTNKGGLYELPKLPVHWFGVWNKLFNSKFINDNVIRFDESLQYGEDGLFVLECLRHDGRIYHAEEINTTVIHHFDNEASLSKVKTLPDILKYINLYQAFIEGDDSPKFKAAVCLELSRLWAELSKQFIE